MQMTAPEMPRTIVRMNKTANAGSLVFLPDFGGNVIYAQPLVRALVEDISCYGMRLAPEMVENLDRLSLVDIAKRFAEDLRRANLPQPLHIAGFSFAGLLAFETARHVNDPTANAGELIILDMRIQPREFLPRLRLYPVQELFYCARFIAHNWKRLLPGGQNPLILHRYGQIRMDLSRHAEAHRMIIRQLYGKMATYRPRPWTGSATVFRAKELRWGHRLDDLGWSSMIDGPLSLITVPGDHLTMLSNPDNAAVLAGKLRQLLTNEEQDNV